MNRSLIRAATIGTWPLLLALVLIGCGGSETNPSGSVSGTVLFNDAPVEAGVVNFEAPGTGEAAQATITDGEFTLSTPLAVGTYNVTITPPPEPPPVPGETPPPVEAKDIPARYRDPKTSDLTAEVKEGTNQFTFKMVP